MKEKKKKEKKVEKRSKEVKGGNGDSRFNCNPWWHNPRDVGLISLRFLCLKLR